MHSGGVKAGEGSEAVAVGVRDRWHETRDTGQLTGNRRQVTQDISKNCMVFVLLTAHAKRFSVSICRTFFSFLLQKKL